MKENEMIIKGIITQIDYKSFKKKAPMKNLLSINVGEDFNITPLADCFKDSEETFTPTYIKDFKGYVNLSSLFDIPVRINERNIDFDEFRTEYNAVGSEVKVKITLKDGAIYPVSIYVLKENEFDPFADFE